MTKTASGTTPISGNAEATVSGSPYAINIIKGPDDRYIAQLSAALELALNINMPNGGAFDVTMEGGPVVQAYTEGTSNQVPVFTSQTDISVTVGTNTSVDLTGGFMDPDGDVLTYTTVSNLPSGLSFSIDGMLEGIPTSEGVSSGIVVRATDTAGGYIESLGFDITVSSAANQAPEFTAQANIDISSGSEASVSIATGFSDPDGDTLTYTTASTLPTGITLSPSGLFTGTPAVEGVYSGVVVRATDPDGLFVDSAAFDITVSTPVNNQPQFLTQTNISIQENVAASVDLTGGFTDPDGDVLSYTTTSTLPIGMSLLSTGLLTGTPTVQSISSIVVRATDPDGLFVESLPFNVEITPVTEIANFVTESGTWRLHEVANGYKWTLDENPGWFSVMAVNETQIEKTVVVEGVTLQVPRGSVKHAQTTAPVQMDGARIREIIAAGDWVGYSADRAADWPSEFGSGDYIERYTTQTYDPATTDSDNAGSTFVGVISGQGGEYPTNRGPIDDPDAELFEMASLGQDISVHTDAMYNAAFAMSGYPNRVQIGFDGSDIFLRDPQKPDVGLQYEMQVAGTGDDPAIEKFPKDNLWNMDAAHAANAGWALWVETQDPRIGLLMHSYAGYVLATRPTYKRAVESTDGKMDSYMCMESQERTLYNALNAFWRARIVARKITASGASAGLIWSQARVDEMYAEVDNQIEVLVDSVLNATPSDIFSHQLNILSMPFPRGGGLTFPLADGGSAIYNGRSNFQDQQYGAVAIYLRALAGESLGLKIMTMLARQFVARLYTYGGSAGLDGRRDQGGSGIPVGPVDSTPFTSTAEWVAWVEAQDLATEANAPTDSFSDSSAHTGIQAEFILLAAKDLIDRNMIEVDDIDEALASVVAAKANTPAGAMRFTIWHKHAATVDGVGTSIPNAATPYTLAKPNVTPIDPGSPIGQSWLIGLYDSRVGVLNAAGTDALDGERVATWEDQSGNNNNFTQADDAKRLTYLAADPRAGGLPSLSHNSNVGSHHMTLTENTSSRIYMVTAYGDGTATVFTGYPSFFTGNQNTGGSRRALGRTAAATLVGGGSAYSTGGASINGNPSSLTVLPLPLSVMRFDTDNQGNGILQETSIGNQSSFTDRALDGPCVFFALTNGGEDPQFMEGWLAHQAGINSSLVAGHPYKTVAPG